MALSKVTPQKTPSGYDEATLATAEAITVDPAFMREVIGRLTDLYSNPVEATLRETVSNAVDATVGLPSPRAIEVHLPTPAYPHLRVRDYGRGMSPEQTKVFTSYVSSDKLTDTQAIGAYGLGAKAPLAYAREFSVETTQAGVTTSFVVARLPQGMVTLKRETEVTGKPTGTTVTVPVPLEDVNKFEQAAEKLEANLAPVPLAIYRGEDRRPPTQDSSFLPVGEVALDQEGEVLGRVWVRADQADRYLAGLFEDTLANACFSYNLHGWTYASPAQGKVNGWGTQPVTLMVEVKPGALTFPSSRDEVIPDERFMELHKRLEAQFVTLNAERLTALRPIWESMEARRALLLILTAQAQGRLTYTSQEVTLEDHITGEVQSKFPRALLRHPAGDPLALFSLKTRFATYLQHGYRDSSLPSIFQNVSRDGVLVREEETQTATREGLVKWAVDMPLGSLLGSVQGGSKGYRHLDPLSFIRNITVVVTGVDDKLLQRLATSRVALLKHGLLGRARDSVLFLRDTPSKKEEAFLRDFLPYRQVTFLKAPALLQSLKDARAAERKVEKPKAIYAFREIYRDGVTKPEDLNTNSRFSGVSNPTEHLPVDDPKIKNNLVVVGTHAEGLARALILDPTVDTRGKVIYALPPERVDRNVASTLTFYKNVAVEEGCRAHPSQAYQAFEKAFSRELGPHLLEGVQVTEAEAVAAFLAAHGVTHIVQAGMLALLRKLEGSTPLGRALELIGEAATAKTPAFDRRHRERYFEHHLPDPALRAALEAFVKVFQELPNSTTLEDLVLYETLTSYRYRNCSVGDVFTPLAARFLLQVRP